MIDADDRAAMQETVRGAIADALASRRAPTSTRVLASSAGSICSTTSRATPSTIVFGALGATNAAATALDDVIAVGARREPRADLAVLLPRFAAGIRRDASTRASCARRARDGSRRHRRRAAGGVRHGIGALVVRVPTAAAEVRAVHGIDPDGGRSRCACESSAPRRHAPRPAAWQSAVALGRRAVAHQIAGASRAMLGLARTHALERVQFGRPIARFQAVRHRLADALVAVEALEAALAAAREEPNARHRGAREGRRRTHRPHGGRALPAGARGHRLHHRARVPPLPQADARARGTLRIGGRDRLDVGRRLLAARRVPTLIEL